MGNTKPKEKMSSSGALIKEAEELSEEDTDGSLSPVQLIKKHIIAADEAILAKDMLTIQKLENQKRITELKKEMAGPQTLPQPQQSAHTTLLGTSPSGNPPIVSILNTLPEEERRDFLEQNKDAIFQQTVAQQHSNAPLMAQLLQRQQTPQQPTDNMTGFANLLLAVNAMSESRAQSEREMLLNMMNMMAQNSAQQKPQNGNESAMVKLLERLNQKVDESNQAVRGEIENMKTGYQQQLITMQERMMEAQTELVRTQYATQIEQLQKAIENRSSQETFANNIQGMIQNLQKAGVNLTNETAEQERIRREYTLKERELEINAEDRAREHAARLEEARARQQMWSGLGSVLSSGMEAMRIQKAIEKGGSPAAKKLTGRS